MSNNKIFAKILSFLNELNRMFGDKDVNIFNYYKVCKHTPITKQNIIKNHVTLFSNFLLPNKDNIIKQNFSKLNPSEIRMSDKTYIDFKQVFEKANKEWRPAIFQHLQYLLYLIHPEEEVKEALVPTEKETSKETEVLNNFVEKLQENFKNHENKNPVELGLDLLKNGTFMNMYQDINKSLQNGDLKLDKLLGSVQNIIGELTQELPNTEGTEPASSLLNNMSNMLGNINPDGTTKDGNVPDITQMLSGLTGGSGMSEMLSSVMGSISNNTQSSESPDLDIGQLMTTMGPLMSQMMGGDLSQLMGQMNMENKEQDESY
uniref:Uncharacterized protein n=1 Tax=viral metagenome TaxID=1070528 RepID=A0A6C0HDF9_9ZZZZ